MSPEMAMSARPSHTPSNTLVLTTFESSHETGREQKNDAFSQASYGRILYSVSASQNDLRLALQK